MSKNKRGGEPQPREASPPPEGKVSEKKGGPPPLDLAVAKLTDVGRSREHNEDYVSFYVPPDAQQRARRGAIYAVADGMGGHQAGEVASQGAVELVIGQYYSDTDPDVGTSLVRAFHAANRLIYEQAQADQGRSGMGTTLVAAVVLGRKVYVASVGDSRAYLINQKGIRQITEDHSWVAEQVRMGLLTPEQARRHPQRNVVTRALGSRPTVEVDLFEGEINEGDHLLLCTDGVTGHLEDAELAVLVQGLPPEEAARQIVAQANERGGHDNMGIILVRALRALAPASAAATTVAAPAAVPAALVRRRGRLSPAVVALMTVAAVLVLAGAGLGAWWFVLRDGGPGVAESTPTLEATVPSETAALVQSPPVGEAGATADFQATETAPGTAVEPVEETPGGAATAGMPGTPTVTLAPTETASSPPPPTSTPGTTGPTRTRQPTRTAAPTATPYPAPVLVTPQAETSLHGVVDFEWQWDHAPLGDQLHYDLRIGLAEEASTGVEPLGVLEPTKELTGEVDLDKVTTIQNNLARTDRFYWTVVVVRVTCQGCTPQIVGRWSEKRVFIYAEPSSPGGPGGPAEPPEGPPPGPPEEPPPRP